MLNIQPPYLDVGNLRIFTDDTDKDVFYYVNQKPKLCFTETGKPALTVYAVVPESGVGKDNDSILETGLSIDLDLGVTDAELEAARNGISNNFKRTAKTLSPAPLHKGTVTLTMVQKADAETAKNWYVSTGFSPSMIGTNRVSLAVRTTGEDAKRLVAALSNNQIMATIRYDLDVVGITPVYKAMMKVDLQQVYHHIDSRTKHNYIYYNKDIEKIVDELEESHALTIEIEEMDPDIKAEAMKTLMNELKSDVIKLFFTEDKHLSGTTTAQDIKDGAVGFFSQMAKLFIPNYSYHKKEVDETRLQSYEINLRQKNAKTFPISPQGQLKEIIDSANVKVEDCITWVLLDELEVKGQTVTVRLAANTFEGNFIKSVVTFCRVIDTESGNPIKEPVTLAFDSVLGKDNEEKVVLSKDFTYTRYHNKQYRYEYWSHIYLDTEPGLLPSPLKTKVCTTESNYIYINPADYYKTFKIDLNLPDLSVFDQVSMILAKVNVLSEELDGKTVLQKDLVLDKEHPKLAPLSIITEHDMNLSYTVDFTYVVPNAKDLMKQIEAPQKSSIFLVPNPFENKWQVELECLANWETIERVIVETRFKDTEQEDPVTNIFTFKEDHKTDTLSASCSLDTEKRKFEYYFRVYRRDGSKTEGGWIQVVGESYVALDVEEMKSVRTIRARLKNPDDFKRYDVDEIKLSLFLSDDSDPIVKQIVKADSVVEFEYPWEKGDSKVYAYKFTAKDEDKSVVFQSKKIKDDSDELLLEFIDD